MSAALSDPVGPAERRAELARELLAGKARPVTVRLVEVALNGFGGRSFTGSLTRHVFESLAHHAAICLHVRLIEGRDPHHIVEAQFKALARALRAACAYDDRVLDVPSTKGAL